MKVFKAILFLYIIIILTSNIPSVSAYQNDSAVLNDSIAEQNDSANNAAQINFNKKLEEIKQQRKDDSIKKADLEIQINSLKTTDNLKKEELQKQLQDLKDAQSSRLAQKKEQINSMRHTAKAYRVEF